MTTLVWLNFVRWEVAFGASHRLDGIRSGSARPRKPQSLLAYTGCPVENGSGSAGTSAKKILPNRSTTGL